jgi:hypothetical protein
MKAEGIQFNNPNWYISRGGDPVNTPYLFLYDLLKLMEFQVIQAYLNKNKLKAHLTEFINTLEASTDWFAIESKARAAVNRFMYRFGAFEMLDFDTEKGSLLAKALKKSNDPNNIFLYNSIRNFLYLLGYRSYRDLLELLNAGEAISTALHRIGKGAKERNTVQSPDIHKLLKTIREKYSEQT